MQVHLTITVSGIVELPSIGETPRERTLLDVLSQAIHDYFPELQADPDEPMISVHMQDIKKAAFTDCRNR
jgi:hypothetical protein